MIKNAEIFWLFRPKNENLLAVIYVPLILNIMAPSIYVIFRRPAYFCQQSLIEKFYFLRSEKKSKWLHKHRNQ
jgi:hypothetical protein